MASSPQRFRKAQRLSPGEPLVDLFELDMGVQAGPLLRWTSGPLGGVSPNVLQNPCVKNSIAPWSTTNTSERGPASDLGAEYSVPIYGNGYARNAAGLGAGISMTCFARPDTGGDRVPVTPGVWVSFQARVANFRCRTRLRIGWYNAAGVNFASTYSTAVSEAFTNTDRTQAASLRNYRLLHMAEQPPATAVTALAAIVSDGGAGTPSPAATNPYVFWTWAMLAVYHRKPRGVPPWSMSHGYGEVAFDGETYTPMPIKVEGVAMRGAGQLPRPRVTVPDHRDPTLGITALMDLYGDLIDCKVSRKRVWRSALDGQAEADTSDFYGPETWYVDRIVEHLPGSHATFELVALLDLQGLRLPRRQVIAKSCTATYRRWTGATFAYGGCRYGQMAGTGSGLWTSDGTPTVVSSEDVCGKRLSDCSLRFGSVLATWAFPGVQRWRV
jgi:lambda family phage minor tail protein L